MAIPNTFPIFEVDQVLTNKHLNDLFNYLDEQSRLARIKLIGSGIVCGLELTMSQKFIHISKGCGLTSQGYLVMQCDKDYSHYRPYASPTLPDDLQLILQCDENREINRPGIPFFGTYGNQVLELITTEEFKQLDDPEQKKAIALSDAGKNFTDRYAVVLFLKAVKADLKNCDTNDCNDKGSRMNFEVKVLLAEKSLLDKIQNRSNPKRESLLHHVELKRYNVPTGNLKSAEDVLTAFVRLVDDRDGVLTRLSNDLIYCWEEYNYLLKDETINPFKNVLDELKKTLEHIVKYHPVFIQYFYDFIDDLIKAFYEFKHKVFDVMGECCGDELRFPFHLVLGEPSVNTTTDNRSAYRQYFIYSPLFDAQSEKVNEIRSLFARMRLMVREFVFNGKHAVEEADLINFANKLVKITPSQYQHADLSHRCIPYYYRTDEPGNELYPVWNYDKTRRGNARFALGYNAWRYNSADTVKNPLFYDIERFNFFRIEGHIGKKFTDVVSGIKEMQQNFNLPFDVVALSADYIGAILKGKEPQCVVQDLESEYRVLIAEFICKMHDSLCAASIREYPSNRNIEAAETFRASFTDSKSILAEAINLNIRDVNISTLVNEYHASRGYVKGDTLRRLCHPVKGTAGSAYLAVINHNKGVFINPVTLNMNDAGSQYDHHLFDYIDTFETMFSILMSHELSTLNTADFLSAHRKYTSLNLLVKSGMVLHTCMVERLEALKNEYLRRVALYRMAKNFSHYFKTHGGIEHKAGTPMGGTFIVVYHEERHDRVIDLHSLVGNKELNTMLMTHFQGLFNPTLTEHDLEFNTKLLQVATLYRDPELYLRYKETMNQYLDDCSTMPVEKRARIKEMIEAPPPRQNFYLSDGMVIADFYVPYICCSDCPPIAYILPEKPQEVVVNPTITLDKYKFCSDDKGEYPVKVTPPGGTLDGPGVIKTGENYFFSPATAKTGIYTLTYTTADKKTASARVEVTAMPIARITPLLNEVNVGDQLIFEASTSDNILTGTTKYHWSIAVNSVSLAPGDQPTFSYPVKDGDKEIAVNLTLSNGDCINTASSVTIQVLEKIIVKEINKIFCFKNVVDIEPNAETNGVVTLLDSGGLTINENRFIIFDVPLKETTAYNIVYQAKTASEIFMVKATIIVIVADTKFHIEYTEKAPKLKKPAFMLKSMGADNYYFRWTLTSNNQTLFTSNVNPAELPQNLSDINSGMLILYVREKINKCEGQVELPVNYEFFRKIMESGGGINFP